MPSLFRAHLYGKEMRIATSANIQTRLNEILSVVFSRERRITPSLSLDGAKDSVAISNKLSIYIKLATRARARAFSFFRVS